MNAIATISWYFSAVSLH